MRRSLLPSVVFILMLLVSAWPALAEGEGERKAGYYTMVDKDTGQVICRTGLVIYPGDKYLTGNNLLYKVVRLDGDTAYADFLGREELHAEAPVRESLLNKAWRGAASMLGLARLGGGKAGPVAIYHTHSDESYLPSDGTQSRQGLGGVYQVGKAMTERLRREGTRAVHSFTNHNPHDGMAYERSRRTATDLLRQNPAALLDLHRDAAPRQEYADRIEGQGVTKIQIVLGRSNPNLKANEAFAKRVKAVIDRQQPGLIKGIYYGRGKYNQDLSARALLLEMGAQSNARESAERGAQIFAAAVRNVVATSPTGTSLRGESGGAWRSILYVVGGVVAVAALFLFINAGSLSGAGRNLGRFFKREFASALGEKKPPRRKPPEEGGDR